MEIIIDVQEHEPGVSEEIKVKGELVRCKDCKHGEPSVVPLSDNYYCKHQERVHKPEWFCADGVRRE